jgi:hypothetical protein
MESLLIKCFSSPINTYRYITIIFIIYKHFDYIAIVFVAAGVGLGAVLAGGNRLLPGVGLGSLLVQVLAQAQSGNEHAYGALVVAMHRQGEDLRRDFGETELKFGDVLLIEGLRNQIQDLLDSGDFVVVTFNDHGSAFATLWQVNG